MMAALWARVALADPVALRGLVDEATAVVGLHDVSVAAPLGEWSLAATTRWDRGAVDIAAGQRWTLTRGGGTWRAEAGVAGGDRHSPGPAHGRAHGHPVRDGRARGDVVGRERRDRDTRRDHGARRGPPPAKAELTPWDVCS